LLHAPAVQQPHNSPPLFTPPPPLLLLSSFQPCSAAAAGVYCNRHGDRTLQHKQQLKQQQRYSPAHSPPEDAGWCAVVPHTSPCGVCVVLLAQEPLILHLLAHQAARDADLLAADDHLQ
jgi:hypothetical protein